MNGKIISDPIAFAEEAELFIVLLYTHIIVITAEQLNDKRSILLYTVFERYQLSDLVSFLTCIHS